VTADSGYESEEAYTYLRSAKQKPYIKPQTYEKWKKQSFKQDISKRENMGYDEKTDTYTCHAGKSLSPIFMKKQKSKSGYESEVTVYECEDCTDCPYKERCTKAKGNKRLYISKSFLEKRQESYENILSETGINRLDANREQRERYHELSRSGDDVPLDYGASANELFFPDMLNDVLEKQLRKGDFIDAIFYCPYDIHELVTEEYLSKILWELNEEHKELLFLCAVRLFSSTRIAKIRNQSDRNIRKVRGTMLKKIRKKLLLALLDKAEKQQPMTLLEKDF